jgi:hypothetical protein
VFEAGHEARGQTVEALMDYRERLQPWGQSQGAMAQGEYSGVKWMRGNLKEK